MKFCKSIIILCVVLMLSSCHTVRIPQNHEDSTESPQSDFSQNHEDGTEPPQSDFPQNHEDSTEPPQSGLVDSTAVQPGRNYNMLAGFSDPQKGLILCADDSYIYELHAQDTGFFRIYYIDEYSIRRQSLPQDIVIEGYGYAHWETGDVVPPYTYIEVLIKQGEQYVGYAVVCAHSDVVYNAQWYPIVVDCKVLAESDTDTVLTAEYLKEQIDKAIEMHEPRILELYQ